MSQWTHIAAIFRIDCIFRHESPIEYCYNIISRPAPTGSEGGLAFQTWINNDLNSVTAYTVTAFGDLRDFGLKKLGRIEEWLDYIKRELPRAKMILRQAIVQVDVEFNPIILYSSPGGFEDIEFTKHVIPREKK